MKKACYFGIYDPKHWRTRIIMRGLRKAGYEIIECRVDPRQTRGLSKYIELYKKFKNFDTRFNFILVGFPGYLAAVVARLIGGAPVIFDAYISYFDSLRDRKNYPVAHPIMWLAWLNDFISGNVSSKVLTINGAYRNFFINTLKVSERKVEVLHKGADEEIFYPRDQRKNDKSIIGWWGSYIPLHGLPTIIDAADMLKGSDIEFELIGGGQLFTKIKAKAEDLGLNNVRFASYMPQERLVEEIANFDIVLGIFSPEPKAKRCVTNKVYEAMAMGKAIITEDSPANRETFSHGENVWMIEAGNPRALADAILMLSRDAALRVSLGRGARRLFEERFTAAKIEDELLGIISRYA